MIPQDLCRAISKLLVVAVFCKLDPLLLDECALPY